jgi:hypothetical protein
MMNISNLTHNEKCRIVEQIFEAERKQILDDARLSMLQSGSLDDLVEFTSCTIDDYMKKRNPLILSAFRGLRKIPTAPWTYSEGIALECVYNVAAVRLIT